MAFIPKPFESPKLDVPPPTPPSGTLRRSITQEFRAVARGAKVWTSVVTVVGVCGVLGSLIVGYEIFTSKAEAAGEKGAKSALDERLPKIDAGLQLVTERHDDLHGDFVEHVKDEKEARRRQERKIDLLLRKEGIKNPAPTPTED
jgi:ABC-type Na+ efflux pump permease subunit